MKRYDIQKIQDNEYEIMVFSTSFETPLQDVDDISKDLSNCTDCKVKVVFDLLLNMGNGSERYAEVFFDGREFDKSSFKFISVDKKSGIRKISTDYFKNNADMLANSVLSSMQKQLILRGATL